MYLKELTLRGFKSFANPTTLRFEPGITAIVGPNGSGKSNIVDALAWVMGEQGARALRGSSMEDVIFAGTATRPALGRAQVSLTIDNSDHALNIDYSEVTISRTLFRNGGSDYAINGSPVRLLDVQDLLSDAGLGQQMHVIVGQGQLSRILNSDPQGHRAIIEEAAGILKHRKRKQRSLRRLSAAKANLDRLDDLLGEIDRQMRPLARQAKASRRADAVRAAARDAQARLLADDAQQLLSARQKNSDELGAVRTDLLEQRLALARIKVRIETIEDESSASNPALTHLADQLHQLTLLDGRFESLADLAGERARAAADGLSQLDARPLSDPGALTAHANELSEDSTRARSQQESAEQNEQQATKKRADCESQLASLRQTISQLRSARADRQSHISRLEQLCAAQKSTIDAFDQRLSDTKRQSADVSARLAANQKEVAALVAQQKGDDELVTKKLDQVRSELADCADAIQQASASYTDLDNQRIRFVARSEALHDTIRSRHDASPLSATHGVQTLGSLSEHIHVVPGWEEALAAALSIFSDALLVANADQIPQALAAARQKKAERTALIAVSDSRQSGSHEGSSDASVVSSEKASKTPSDSLSDQLAQGDVVPAISLLSPVDADEAQSFAGLFSTLAVLLEGIGVSEGADTALAACRAGNWRCVVTKAGEVITPDAAVTVAHGAPSDLALVARKNEADKSAHKLATKAQSAQKRVDELKQQRDQLRSQIADLTKQRDAARLEASKTEAALAIRTKQIASDERELTEIAESARRLREQKQEAVQKQDELTKTLAQARSDESTSQSEDELTEREQKVEQQLSAARETEVQAHLSAEEARRHADSLDRQIGLLRDEAEQAGRAVKERERRRGELTERQQSAQSVVDHVSGVRHLLAACIAQTKARHERAQKKVSEHLDQLTSLRHQRDSLEPHVSDLANREHALDLERERQATKLGQLQADSSSHTGLQLDELVCQYGPDQPVPDMDDDGMPIDGSTHTYVRSDQQERLEKAQKQIARLGKVNPLAGEEYDALQERQKYLATQRDDVSSSRKQLLRLVDNLDTTMEEVFTSAFSDISTAFSRIFADLFPGGRGRLRLDDPDHPLTSGVIVEASPAGKKVRELSLLSGGEKSLSALALLLAISQARPSPFYVMDEVEAALDDLNLTRLISALKRMGTHVQLIIITHQQRTMAIADALYGVSMRADGVTAVISQKMEDIAPSLTPSPASPSSQQR